MRKTILLMAILMVVAPGAYAVDYPAEPSDISGKLLEEVHALRLAIQKSNSINSTVLITVELTKMANLKVENLEQGIEQIKSEVAELDEQIASDSAKLRESAENPSVTLSNQEAADLKTEQANLQEVVQRNTRKRNTLLEKQNNLQAQLGREQSRLTALQDRLKNLEAGVANF
jgi:peptidoglycan hydrolase CwlO-like protein